eukprot:SRR837773.26505.p1 GENE.SRR837773.26505~~SRR837773.26505.p1  ORF type:complete len:309 (+),score=66.73 SRR837773.26505:37-927(+)
MVAQCMCYPVHLILTRINPPKAPADGGERPRAPFHVLLMVTLFDISAMVMMNTNYGVLPGSLVQMLRGFRLIMTFFLSKLVLRSEYDKAKVIGIIMNSCGICFTALSSCTSRWQGASDNVGRVHFALAIGIASNAAGAVQYIYERQTMDAYDMPALLFTGVEGMIGLPIVIFCLIFANVVGWEDSLDAVSKLYASESLVAIMVCFLFIVCCFQLSGCTVGKYGSPVLRVLLEIARIAIVWTLEVVQRWVDFSFWELFAYLLTSVGTMIYGKVFGSWWLSSVDELPKSMPAKGGDTK